MSLWQPAYLAAMMPYIKNGDNPNTPGYGRWNHPPPPGNPNAPGEGGVDLPAPTGTPVFALGDGPIVGAGYWNDQQHGVITQRITVPGYGTNDIYYQHIMLAAGVTQCIGSVCAGQMLSRGQQIGTVGGFGETEIGFNANWGGVWGTNHPAAWVSDPRPLIAALMGAGNPGGGLTGVGGALAQQASVTLAPNADVAGVLTAIDTALAITNPFDVTQSTGFSIFGVDIGGTNPASYTVDVLANLGYDFSALLVRALFILIGLGILFMAGQVVIQHTTNQILEPIGGVQGAVKLAGALA